eukprot:gene6315-biopygen1457
MAIDAFIVRNVLSAEECDGYIKQAEMEGFKRPGINGVVFAGRRERVVMTSEELAARLWDKIRDNLTDRVLYTKNASFSGPKKDVLLSGLYTPTHVSDFYRFSKYCPGDEFLTHTDTCFAKDEGETGLCTVLLYLNGGDFQGGETVLYNKKNGLDPELTVTPERGLALVFYHMVPHARLKVLTGHKYVVRTEVMYRRVSDGV